MKKLCLIGVVLMMAIAPAFAEVEPAVVWMAGYGVFAHNSPELVVDNDNYIGVAQDTSVLWQLIWAGPNNVADAIDLSATGFISGDDLVIGSRTIAQGGSDVFDSTLFTDDESTLKTFKSDFVSVMGETAYNENASSLYVFQRVFEESNPAYNYQSDLTLLDSRYTDGAQKIYVDAAGNFAQGVKTNVPEPATMSLLGLGALAMVLRRKLRK